jgi:dihydrodipicolinate synthase/N-acetylneuraminate lyase
MKRFPRCILATQCVPWDEHGRLAEAIFRHGVRTTLEIGTRHLYILGTAGEGYAVTEHQFDQVVEVFADEMRRADAQPMVGLISLSLGTILERIERCRERGVAQFQISLPAWGALNDREMFAFFDAVCNSAPDCQFLHYNLPRAQRMLTGRDYGKLSELHPNLVATKNTGDSMTLVQDLLREAPLLQHFLS